MESRSRPTWPGTHPEALAFPHERAATAAREARGLADELRQFATTIDHHTDLLATGGFEGVFATWVFHHVDACHELLRVQAARLDDQADVLDELAGRASSSQEARSREIAHWEHRFTAWHDWTPPVAVGA